MKALLISSSLLLFFCNSYGQGATSPSSKEEKQKQVTQYHAEQGSRVVHVRDMSVTQPCVRGTKEGRNAGNERGKAVPDMNTTQPAVRGNEPRTERKKVVADMNTTQPGKK